jgi:serine/threonine protein kinase
MSESVEIRIARKYRVGLLTRSGTFAQFYSGVHVETGQEVLIKLEPKQTNNPRLLEEAKILQTLAGGESAALPYSVKISYRGYPFDTMVWDPR